MKAKLIALFTIFALLFSGCSSLGGISTFTIPIENLPHNLDPQIASSKEEILVLTNTFDGLFEIVDGKPVKNLVEDYTVSSDGKLYTFLLKKTSVYHYKDSKSSDPNIVKYNNLPVTAHDFVFAFKRLINPKTQSPYAGIYANIKNVSAAVSAKNMSLIGVKALDDYTLQIELERPDYDFINKLCHTAAMPCNETFFNNSKGAYGLGVKNILSNGPFKLNYLEENGKNATILRVNDERKKIERIRLVKTADKTPEILYNEKDVSGYFATALAAENADGRKEKFSGSTINLIFNFNNEYFSNKNIRSALAYYAYAFKNSGANMEAVMGSGSVFPDTVTFMEQPLNSQITPVVPTYMSKIPKDMLNIGLNEIGKDKSSNITVLMPSDSLYTIIFENINQLWQKDLGMFFNVEFLPYSQILQRVESQNFDIAFISHAPNVNSPFVHLRKFSSLDTELDTLIFSAEIQSSPNLALSYISKAQDYLLQNALTVPMGKETFTYVYDKAFSDVKINPFGNIINLKYANVR